MKKYKKIIVIAAIFLMVMLTAAGGSAWLILSEIQATLNGLTQWKGLILDYSTTDTSIYFGEDYNTPDNAKVEYSIVGEQINATIPGTWKFDTDGDGVYQTLDEIMRVASGTSATIALGTKTCPAKYVLDQSKFGALSFALKADYEVSEVAVTFPTLNAVATIGSTYYATIDGALSVASSGNTVNVLVLGTDIDNSDAKQAKTITTNIKSGVTLYVAYDNSVSSTYDSSLAEKLGNSNIACTNLVFISGNVTNNGTITIPAQLTAQQTTLITLHGVANNTSVVGGKHAVVQCLDGGSITSNGTINCYGFIEGDVILNSGSNMMALFSHMDHRGGNRLTSLANKKDETATFPIKRYYIGSVKGRVRVNYGATFTGHAFIYVSLVGVQNDTVTMVSTADGDGFVRLSEGAYATISYDDALTQYANKINLYGSASINSITVTASSATLTTTYSFIPFSYLWEISLHDIDTDHTNDNAIVSTGTNNLALLPGSKVTVGDGVTLDASSSKIAVYTSNASLNIAIADGKEYGTAYNYGELIIEGTLTANAIGGIVTAGSANASISYSSNSVQTYDISGHKVNEFLGATTSVDVYTAAVNHSLTGAVMQNTIASASGDPESSSATEALTSVSSGNAKTYFGTAVTGTSNFAWRPETITVTMFQTANSAGISSGTLNLPANGSGYDPLKLSINRNHYSFNEWHNNSGQKVLYLYKDSDIYAQWTPNTYTLNYQWVMDGTDATLDDLTDNSFTYETTPIPLPDTSNLTVADCEFAGWYTDEDCTQSAAGLSGAQLLAITNGDATLYGLWVSERYILKFENDYYNDFGDSNDEFSWTETRLATATWPTISETHKTTPGDDKYFEGWYYNGTKIDTANTTIKEFIESTGLTVNTTHTITAKWLYKTKLEINYGANNLGLTNPTTAIYVAQNGTYTVSDVTSGDNTVTNSLYSTGWTTSDGVSVSGTTVTVSVADAETESARSTVSITAEWGTKHKVTITNNSTRVSSFKVTVTGYSDITTAGDYYFKPGTTVTITAQVTTTKGGIRYDKVKVTVGSASADNDSIWPSQTVTCTLSDITLTEEGETAIVFANV